jgi:hypothetical protein
MPKGLPPKSAAHHYFMLWDWDGTLERIHHALYVAGREREGRKASPTAAITGSQSAAAQKGAPRSSRGALMRARRSPAASATSSSTRSVSCCSQAGSTWWRSRSACCAARASSEISRLRHVAKTSIRGALLAPTSHSRDADATEGASRDPLHRLGSIGRIIVLFSGENRHDPPGARSVHKRAVSRLHSERSSPALPGGNERTNLRRRRPRHTRLRSVKIVRRRVGSAENTRRDISLQRFVPRLKDRFRGISLGARFGGGLRTDRELCLGSRSTEHAQHVALVDDGKLIAPQDQPRGAVGQQRNAIAFSDDGRDQPSGRGPPTRADSDDISPVDRRASGIRPHYTAGCLGEE